MYYVSGRTTPAKERYTSYELEVLTIIKSLKKLRVYLLGISFKIVTDCQAFTTMNKKNLCMQVARWAFALEEFNYEIQYRPGKNVLYIDALSRNLEILVVNESHDSFLARFKKV